MVCCFFVFAVIVSLIVLMLCVCGSLVLVDVYLSFSFGLLFACLRCWLFWLFDELLLVW